MTRLALLQPAKPRRRNAQAERALLAEVLLHLRRWPVIAIATPNGLHIPATSPGEAAVKARMISRMRGDGMMEAGVADLVIVWNGGGAFVELKRPPSRDLFGRKPAGVPSDAQKAFALRCNKLGIRHAYCTRWDEVEARLLEWGVRQ